MTKGDNNDANDTTLYPVGQSYLHRHQVIGSVRGHIPYIGYAKLIFGDSARMKRSGKGIIGQTLADVLYHMVERIRRLT